MSQLSIHNFSFPFPSLYSAGREITEAEASQLEGLRHKIIHRQLSTRCPLGTDFELIGETLSALQKEFVMPDRHHRQSKNTQIELAKAIAAARGKPVWDPEIQIEVQKALTEQAKVVDDFLFDLFSPSTGQDGAKA